MKRLQPVIWSKGTFLSPQHLQIQDRFIESSLEFRLHALNYCPWGFRELQIDQEALADGTLRISRASGIFADGLLFDIPDSDAAAAPKSLISSFEPDQKELAVYLAVPSYRERGLNVTTAQFRSDTRYSGEVVLMRDENTGLAEKPVMVARKNIRLVAANELNEGLSAMQVANVKRTASGAYTLDSLFVPPLVDYKASSYLVSIVRRLVELLSTKATQLSGMRRQKNQSLADFSASDIPNFWLLHTVNSSFPLFQHLFEANHAHPEKLFAAMLELAGALSTFSTEIRPRDLPKYDHEKLSVCFAELDQQIRLLLETVVPANCISLPLKKMQTSIYAAALADDKYLKNTRMYLAIHAEIPAADLIAKTPQLVKVCSANHIEHLVRMALPGVTLSYLHTPPNSIPVNLNYQYFSLAQSGPAWEAVGRARNLAAYVPEEIRNVQMELVIVLPEKED